MGEPKTKKPCVSSLHPGSAEVAKAMGWPVEVARRVADLPGCPRVRGGKGKRLTSIEAFRSWFKGLAPSLQRSVPAIDRLQRLELGLEIAKLTFAADREVEAERIARAHDHAELVELLDYWRDQDEGEKGERAAKAALGKALGR